MDKPGFDAPKPKSYIGQWSADFAGSLGLEDTDPVSKYAGGFVKTATLFLRGRMALPLTLAAYALDEAKPGDSTQNQVVDGLLGAAKGGAMRGAFSLTSGLENIAAKGVSLGITSRAADIGLSRSTYFDDKGDFSLGQAFDRVATGVFSKQAIGMDIVAFGASAGLLHNADRFAGGAISRSPFLSTMLTGTTFGVTTGGLQEISNQSRTGEWSLGAIAREAALHGALDTVAAIPGGLQGAREMSMLRAQTDGLMLPKGEKTQVYVRVGRGGEPNFDSERAFTESAIGRQRVDARVYKLANTEIVVPESFARQQDAIRRYRTAIDGKPVEEHSAIAQRVLGKNADLANRALPEDFLPALQRLPNEGLIKRLTLLNSSNPEDVWHQRSTGNPEFKSLATSTKDGEITFFRADKTTWLGADLAHEWSHILRDQSPVQAALYDAATRLEGDKYSRRPYADTKADESWAVHLGEDFLHPDHDMFVAFTQNAPLRAAVFAEALKPVLEKSTSPSRSMYLDRLAQVHNNVLPTVRSQLSAIMSDPAHPQYTDAGLLWMHLK